MGGSYVDFVTSIEFRDSLGSRLMHKIFGKLKLFV